MPATILNRLLRRRRGNRRGQMMIVAVAIMVVMLVVIFFIVDLQGVIRSRVKAQTAADSAALSAATWQGRSLNMIGELNLVKASTALIDEVPPASDNSEEGLAASVRVLSQLQTRISYAGPLVGYAASQQAALRNGMRPVPAFADALNRHLNNWVDGGPYEGTYPPETDDGYEWLPAYSAMLHAVADGGIAAKPLNSRYLMGLPELSGEGAWLVLMPDFYDAVHARFFCWFYRRGVEPTDEYDFDNIVFSTNESPFFVGSEFLPLYVSFRASPPITELVPFLNERRLTPLPDDQPGRDDIVWAVFEDDGDGYGWEQTELYSFTNRYLRTPFREAYTYSGAAARFFCTSQPSLITGDWRWRHGETPGVDGASLGDQISWSSVDFGDGSYSDSGERLRNAESSLQALRQRESIESTAAAKPFGSLGDNAPHEVDVVLPVFSQVRLVPNVTVRQNDMERNPAFYNFIIEYFGHPNYPDVPQDVVDRHWYYVSALRQFEDMDSSFRNAWFEYDAWRDSYMAGQDLVAGTGDDREDPCTPPPPTGGGGGGGGSTGGPPSLH